MSRIVTNSSANTVYKNYNQNSMKLANSAEKLATGLRINRAADDSAGLAISEGMRAQVKGTDAANDNISNAINFLNTADGYLQVVSDILGRMEELSVSEGDGTKSTTDKANIDAEFKTLATQLGSISAAATGPTFNGTLLFSAATITMQVGANSADTFTLAGTNLGGAAGFATVAAMTTANSVSNVQAAIIGVSTLRATMGSDQAHLQYQSSALQNYSENISASESRIRNVDMAKETTNFSRFQIQVQAGTAMLAQANQLPQNVLSLLK